MAIIHRKRENLWKESRVIAVIVCSLSLVGVTGCAGKGAESVRKDNGNVSVAQESEWEREKPVPVEISSGTVEDLEEKTGDRTGQDRVRDGDGQETQSVGNEELTGDVYSVSRDSLVVCREESWAEGDASMSVGAAPGYEEEEDLITVYVSADCSYRYKTVKNGGVHPEDISEREGSFADLREGISVTAKGSWQDDGSFRADSIVMSSFE